jgi:hypothetical protein
VSEPTPLLTVELPMRGGTVTAWVQVPRDMTKAEAERIATMVETLPIPRTPHDSPSAHPEGE